MQSCQIRFTRFYFLKENEKENQFCAVSKRRLGWEERGDSDLSVIFQYCGAIQRKGPPGRHVNN